MSVITAEEITNLYLYGQKSVPADLTDEALIRQENKVNFNSVNIND